MTDEEKEGVFKALVQASWDKYNEIFYNQKLDDVLLGAVVASCVKEGHLMLDLNSDGVNHYVRFENPQDKSRLIFRLRHLAEEMSVAKVLGHVAEVVIGYGEKAGNPGAVWSALKSELKSTFLDSDEPGVITFDADLTGGYIYAQVGLILDLNTYLDTRLKVDVPLIRSHIDCTVHALRKYLQGRLALAAA
ncbi:MAG: hypothetical protein AB1758_05190 [Candidatus Eremiobacterota bacterium]